jgi:hypothetical protein
MFVIESSRAERGQAKRTLGADCGAYSGEGPSQRFDGTSSDQLKRKRCSASTFQAGSGYGLMPCYERSI